MLQNHQYGADEIRVYTSEFKHMWYAICDDDKVNNKCFMKIITILKGSKAKKEWDENKFQRKQTILNEIALPVKASYDTAVGKSGMRSARKHVSAMVDLDKERVKGT